MSFMIKIRGFKAQHELLGKIHVQLSLNVKNSLLLETRSEVSSWANFVSVVMLQPLVWPLFLLNEMPVFKIQIFVLNLIISKMLYQ